MANSKYEYVKKFELDDSLLPGCWIVVRIDGKGFTRFGLQPPQGHMGVLIHASKPPPQSHFCRFSEVHGFEKPNDKRALDLMDESAKVQQSHRLAPVSHGCGPSSCNLPVAAAHTTHHIVACCLLQSVMRDFPEIKLAFGESDEYSFVLHKDSNLYGV